MIKKFIIKNITDYLNKREIETNTIFLNSDTDMCGCWMPAAPIDLVLPS